jgi:SAM-dependent methyltransferase
MSIYQIPASKVNWTIPSRLSPEKAFLFEDKGSLNILEIGHTDVAIRNYFLERGHQFTGLDLISNKADFHCDMNFLPFGKNEFDAVLINSTLQYSFSPLQTFCEINRVLKNEGFVTGTIAFLEPGVWKSLYHPTARGLYEMMRIAGFEVPHIWPCWNVIDALIMAIENDNSLIEKETMLQNLKNIQRSDEYSALSMNVNYAGGLNFQGIKMG